MNNIQDHTFIQDKKGRGFLKVMRMEDIYSESQGKADTLHRHDYYTVIWIMNGKGTHEVDFQQFALAANQVFFVAPGRAHRLIASEEPNGWVLTFHPDFLVEANIDQNLIYNINLFKQYSDSPPLNLGEDQRLKEIMSLMMEFYEDDFEYRSTTLGSCLKLFLLECLRQCDDLEPELESTSCLLIDFKKIVEENFRKIHKVNQYAKMLYITPKHLNSVVKNTIGCTAKEYIIDRLMAEAKRLLLHTDLSVKQIAIELGFKEPLHFNSFFKQRGGQTPLEFRNH